MARSTKLTLVKATRKYAIELAPNLKQSDLDEIEASSGKEPKDLLIESIALSKIAYALIYHTKDGSKEVITLGGVAPHPTDLNIGIPWAFTPNKVRTCPKDFMMKVRQALDEFYTYFPTLTNLVYSQNTTAIRWLKSLGFSVGQGLDKYAIKQTVFLSFIGYDLR